MLDGQVRFGAVGQRVGADQEGVLAEMSDKDRFLTLGLYRQRRDCRLWLGSVCPAKVRRSRGLVVFLKEEDHER